jgi:hypothetical protein
MKRVAFILCLVLAAPGVRAQNPPDTTDDAEAQQLRQELRQRWNQRVHRDLELTDEQAGKLQGTEDRYLQRRREMAQRQRAVNEGLRRQLQPGIAANADSVRKLMDARDRNRTALAQLDRDEDREISGYLTPVQHARYQMMREQLRHRIEQIREQRRARGQLVGPRGAARPRPAKPRRRP